MKIDKKTMLAIGVLATIGVTGLAFMYRREIIKFISGTNKLQRKASKVAVEEYTKWNRQGLSIKEHSPVTLDSLKAYWSATNHSYDQMRSQPWSAAFISYVMKTAGAGKDFPYATSHSTYIVKAIQNRLANTGRFKGYKPEEKPLEVGDLVCAPRSGSGAGYNTTGAYESHCDLCVAIDKKNNQGILVGGNVSDSVSKTYVPLTKDGRVDKTKTSKNYFVIIKY